MSIVNKLIAHSKSNIYPFHMPGHKRRIYPAAPLKSFYEMDITEIDGFDNLHDATGIIRASEKRAAQIFGADNTYFLVNGTTSGMLAAICGTVTSGDAIVVARNCHRCVYNAVMLSGAQPYYVYPERESYCDINAGISAEQIEKMLCNITNAKRMAVVITSPTYEGVISDV